MGTFKLSKDRYSEFHFNLLAGNGEIILTSEAYGRKDNALNGIESVKINSKHPERFEKRDSKDGKLYFVLKAENGQIVGTSQMYALEASREKGIEAVMKNGPRAEMEKEVEE